MKIHFDTPREFLNACGRDQAIGDVNKLPLFPHQGKLIINGQQIKSTNDFLFGFTVNDLLKELLREKGVVFEDQTVRVRSI